MSLPNDKIESVPDDHAFVTPVKLIKTMDDMQKWDKSEAYFVSLLRLGFFIIVFNGFYRIVINKLKLRFDFNDVDSELSPNCLCD